MSCHLPIHTSAETFECSLSASGRLPIYWSSTVALVENEPTIPADQGGQLPIYSESTGLIGTVPFSCPGPATKSTGLGGSANSAGVVDGGVGTSGILVGRLF